MQLLNYSKMLSIKFVRNLLQICLRERCYLFSNSYLRLVVSIIYLPLRVYCSVVGFEFSSYSKGIICSIE